MNESRTDHPGRMLEKVRGLRDDGRLEDWLVASLLLAEEHPDDAPVRYEAARACAAHQRGHEALAHFEAARTLGLSGAESVEMLLRFALALRSFGRLREALARVDEALAVQPNSVAVLSVRALVLVAVGRGGEAVADLLDAVLSGDHPELELFDGLLAWERDELRAYSARR